MFSGKKLLIFGGGFLQQSLINHCKKMGVTSVVIDPFDQAPARETADFFEVVGGHDFEGTCQVVEKHTVDGIITSATDKPLVMMARIAEKYNFPFYSVKTAKNCTDKYRMKAIFQSNDIPCAKGYLIKSSSDILAYPVIVKPLDNSGSRGVYFCRNEKEANELIQSTFKHTKAKEILAESFVDGQEYSVESLHSENNVEIVQITEKITSPFPTNVELGHIAPANVSEIERDTIHDVIKRIHKSFQFRYCAAHTEVKINHGVITVIETSPRLGGDFISSDLAPLSTGINMEDELIAMALGKELETTKEQQRFSGAFFFQFEEGRRIKKLPNLEALEAIPTLKKIAVTVQQDAFIGAVQSSLDRHGYFVLQTESRELLLRDRDRIFDFVYSNTEYE
ncbi:MAG: ATP-grasp domain-containing protein [bacterium]|nr:ATP-grasp domain-containing protein [bacterium]